MPFDRIPSELKALGQWVCWRYEAIEGVEKPTKVPYDPRSQRKVSVTDPTQWCDFETAKAYAESGQFDGVGFVLTDLDEFCFFDLDYTPNQDWSRVQQAIFEKLDSYSELSPSGKGLHIIVKGKVPRGIKRQAVEVYSAQRFMTMTGNVYEGKPIANRQELITQIFEEMVAVKHGTMNGTPVHWDSQPQRQDDDAILMLGASQTNNGDHFKALYEGKWEGMYPSQSEADLAFIDMLQKLSENKEQIFRIFMRSSLGQRAKARNRPSYVNYMIEKSFDLNTSPIDHSKFGMQTWFKKDASVAMTTTEAPAQYPPSSGGNTIDDAGPIAQEQLGVNLPPGLVGEIAKYVYAHSFYPVEKIAFVTALGLMAGLCGRQFNVNGAGLNLYCVIVARTASGKEAIDNGITSLMTAVKRTLDGAKEFEGPAEIASGAALLKKLAKQPCMYSIQSEFGLFIQSICAERAPDYKRTLRKVLIDLYTKSGKGKVVQRSIYSDEKHDIDLIYEPAFTIIGESTPSTFYKNFDEELVSMGFIPRMFVVEYAGIRNEMSRERALEPPSELVTRVHTLATHIMSQKARNSVTDVLFSAEAAQLEIAFSKKCNALVNAPENLNNDAICDLWNIAHLLTMKIAALFAVGENPWLPTISAANWNMAQELAEMSARNLVKRFDRGEIGSTKPENEQSKRIKRVLKEYIANPIPNPSYRINQRMINDGIIPYSYLLAKLQHAPEFNKKDVNYQEKGTFAIKAQIQRLIDEGILIALKDADKFNKDRTRKYDSNQIMYYVADRP